MRVVVKVSVCVSWFSVYTQLHLSMHPRGCSAQKKNLLFSSTSSVKSMFNRVQTNVKNDQHSKFSNFPVNFSNSE